MPVSVRLIYSSWLEMKLYKAVLVCSNLGSYEILRIEILNFSYYVFWGFLTFFCLFLQIIYVARDPRDVIISLYHFARLHVIWGFKGTFDDFIDDFLNDRSKNITE